MSATYVSRGYRVTIAELVSAGEQIGGAMKDDLYGASVMARMPGTFQTDYDAAVAALATAMTNQSGARGSVNTAVVDAAAAMADCVLTLGTVRGIAKRSFKGQDALLHSEFTVGERGPRGLASIIARAEIVNAACVKYAEPLALKGWSAAETTALAALVTTLKEARDVRHNAAGTQHSASTQQVNMANAVYDLIRSVQIVANQVYPAAKASLDATIVKAREQFLLGIFPPRDSADANPAGGTPTGGTGQPGASAPGATEPAAGTATQP